MASEQQNKAKYHSWVKTSLSLLYLKEGIADEMNQQADNLHGNIKQLAETKCKNATTTACSTCTSKSIKKTKRITQAGTNWYVNCRSNVCNHWLDALIRFHEHLPSPNVEWVNTNPTLWPSQPWEVAKVFQPYGCEHHRNAGDSDVAALLTFMLDCKFFNNVLSNKQILREIKECRNRTMHSANLEIEDADMLKWHNDMIALLEDKKHLGQLPSCQAAADKIRELRDTPIEVSFNKEEENTALSLQISTLTVEISSIQITSDELRCDLNELTKKGQSSTEECEQIRKDLSSTGENVSQLKEQLGMMKKSLGDLDMPHVMDKMSVLQQRLQSLSEQNQEDTRMLDDRISAIEDKVGVMEARLESHEADIASLQKDQVRNLEADTIRTQKHLVSLYNKNYQRVPIYPLRPEWREHVADLFVKPSMIIMNPRGVRFLQTSGGKGLKSSSENTETRVKNLRDIFYSGDVLCNDIYIMGQSGTGKSTLCEFFVHLWVNGLSKHGQDSEEDNFMNVFTFLFYISLREAKSCDVEVMIRDQLELEHVDVSSLLLDHTCLIILDGLDEFSQRQAQRSTCFSSQTLPWRRHSEKCTVLTTSRPWKLEMLARELEDKVERQISLTGLEKTSQQRLINKVITLLNFEHKRDKRGKDFIQEVTNQNLNKYMETPILLTQMLGLWFSGESFGSSQCAIYSKMIEKQIQFTEEIRGFPTEFSKEENPSSQTKAAIRATQEKQIDSEITSHGQLPVCFQDHIYSQRYISLLQKLSRFAYKCLFGENKETALVFDHEQMEICGLSTDEIQKALHMGLLTQYKVFGEITQRLKSISFIHKSHQEFFAAIYLSQALRSSEWKKMFDGFSDLNRVLEIEKVFTFASGMNPKLSCEIAKVIMDKASEDARVQQYRKSCSYDSPYEDLMQQIQGLILAGIEEGEDNGHNINAMQLHDIWMENEHHEFPPNRILGCTQALDISAVKSIVVKTTVYISRDTIWQLIMKASPNMHKIVLLDCDINVDMIQKMVHLNPNTLQALGIYFEQFDNVDFSRMRRNWLWGRTSLQKILSAPKSSLGIYGITLTHTQLEFLCRHLSKCSYNEVRLGCLECTTHEYRATNCKQHLDLSASENISRLVLWSLPVQEVTFMPENLVECRVANLPSSVATHMIRCLRNAKILETFVCQGVSESALVELERTLPCLVSLKTITLSILNLCGHEQVIFTPEMKELEEIYLYGVTITADHFRSFLSSIPSHHRVRMLLGSNDFQAVTITSYEMENDIVQQIKNNPYIDVEEYEVEYEDGECIVHKFWFKQTSDK